MISYFLTSCKKNVDNATPTTTTSTVTVINTTFTTIAITLNGESRNIEPSSKSIFIGIPNTQVIGIATTSGTTKTGNQVGQKITNNISGFTFPAAGTNYDFSINVASSLFFVKVKNISAYSIQKLYLNYGLSSQTVDNIVIPNDGNTYNTGYYQAFTNSNIRAENGSIYWNWINLNLPFTANQYILITAN